MNQTEKTSFPDRASLEDQYSQYTNSFDQALNDLQRNFRIGLKKRGLHATIKHRVKDFESIYAKVLTKKIGFDEALFRLTDIMGLRIICPFMEDVKTAETFIRSHCHVVEEERKGENLSFREFGYESMHFLITIPEELKEKHGIDKDFRCEVQIRTILQDAWAEVEHELVYKAEFSPYDEPLKRKLAALNANLSLSDVIFQEIRDYQRQLHAELDKRRLTFNKIVEHQFEGQNREQAQTAGTSREAPFTESDATPLSPSDKGNIDNMLLHALHAHNEENYPTAISIYTQILEMNPQGYVKSIIYVHRGMANFGRSLYDQAEQDFTQALQTDPENEKAYYYRGIVYSINEEYTKALEDFNTSLTIKAHQSWVYYSRSQVYYHIGDYPAAMGDCRSALSLRPDYPEANRFKDFIQSKMNF